MLSCAITISAFPILSINKWKQRHRHRYMQSVSASIHHDSLRVLEWDKLSDLVASFATTSLGRQALKRHRHRYTMQSVSASIHHDSLRVLEWDMLSDLVASFATTSLGRHALKGIDSKCETNRPEIGTFRFYGKNIQMRTLYHLKFPWKEKRSGSFPTKCSLRVLRISSFELSSLGNLIHLRYLELHDSDTKTLPDSICTLQKLKILKLIGCQELSCLPKNLSCLQNLRHLVISQCSSLSHMFPNIGKLSCLRTLSQYIVSLEQGHSLSELQNLKLGGKLSITGLEFVGSKGKTREANLRKKEDLQELCLSWKRGFCDDNTIAEQVLEELEPHPNLNTLRIDGYQGCHFPRWIGGLTSLVTLELDGGRECKQLPSLGKLPLLRKLVIWGTMEIVYMEDDECYDGVEVMAFPSLEELKLSYLPKLERLLKVERTNMCPRLSHLTISGCPELELLPCHPSIKSLYFKGPNNKSLSSISSFIGLTSLQLHGDETTTTTSFPEGRMRNLTCLKMLEIERFEELKELPDELFYLKALEKLYIKFCPKLECLPEQVWEGLCSLQQLHIWKCEGLRSLPDGIRHLTSLQFLSIHDCQTLIERCKKGTGEDWDKIAHVPRVNIE